MKNKETKSMSALQFMKEFENTKLIMESIAEKTGQQQRAMFESEMAGQDYVDDDGIFDMDSMLDVNVSDVPENQPRIYNQPIEELSASDKALIIDEFTKKLSTIQDEVIDFSDLGPMATVIQNQFGFKQDVEKFLRDTIQNASNFQQSQNATRANETVGAVQGTPGDGSPTDIAPTLVKPVDETAPVGGDLGGIPPVGGDMGADLGGIPALDEVPALDTPTNTPAIDDVSAELSSIDSELDGGLGTPDIDAGINTPVDGIEGAPVEGAPVEGGEDIALDIPESTEEVGETTDIDAPEGADDVAVPEVDETPSEENKETEEVEEKEEDENKEDQLLESIKNNYLESMKERRIDAQLEAIKSELKAKTIVESVPVVNVKAQLEAIASDFHAKENAKLEAIENEKKAQLEAIETEKRVKAQLEAIASSYKQVTSLDSNLNALIESYHEKNKSNLNARLEAKEKIKQLDK